MGGDLLLGTIEGGIVKHIQKLLLMNKLMNDMNLVGKKLFNSGSMAFEKKLKFLKKIL